MKIKAELFDIALKETFRISKGESSAKKSCIVSLGEALGECCPSIYYGYSAEDCYRTICRDSIEIPDEIEMSRLLDEFESRYHDRKSMLAGLDMVLHDFISRKHELPLYQYLGIPRPGKIKSSYTISIDEPANINMRLKAADGFASVKVKIGSQYDRENLRLVKESGRFRIRVDANGAYSLDQIMELVPFFNELELELMEQPLKDSNPADLRKLRSVLNAPIFLDESIIEVEDIFKYVDCIDGINIKLQRVGGIRPALKMVQAAKSLGMKIMFGCMLETSIGNSATAQLTGFADYLDLDSSLLLADDPFIGVIIDKGDIILPERFGIGAVRRNHA